MTTLQYKGTGMDFTGYVGCVFSAWIRNPSSMYWERIRARVIRGDKDVLDLDINILPDSEFTGTQIESGSNL